MEFRILGPLEVLDGDVSRTPTAPRMRQLLATLLIRANYFVGIDALVDEIWGDNPPVSAVTTVQTYVHHLRKELDRTTSTPTARLATEAQGYTLHVCEELLDATVFTRIAAESSRLLQNGRPDEACRVARTALSLWRGAVACGVTSGQLLRARAAHLEEVKVQTIDVWLQAEFRLGRPDQVIPDLRSLVISYPLNERLHAHLIGALKQAGRRAEALDAYHHYRRVINTTLGLEPSRELRELQHSVLVEM